MVREATSVRMSATTTAAMMRISICLPHPIRGPIESAFPEKGMCVMDGPGNASRQGGGVPGRGAAPGVMDGMPIVRPAGRGGGPVVGNTTVEAMVRSVMRMAAYVPGDGRSTTV